MPGPPACLTSGPGALLWLVSWSCTLHSQPVILRLPPLSLSVVVRWPQLLKHVSLHPLCQRPVVSARRRCRTLGPFFLSFFSSFFFLSEVGRGALAWLVERLACWLALHYRVEMIPVTR